MALPRPPSYGTNVPTSTSGDPVPQEENTPVPQYFPSPISFPPSNQAERNQNTSVPLTALSINNMDTSHHQILYAQGLEIRKKVVGEDYVANALEKGGSDFLRPLQQFATVCSLFNIYISSVLPAFFSHLENLVLTR
jgi:4-carboxymuconolactone decarboxylase